MAEAFNKRYYFANNKFSAIKRVGMQVKYLQVSTLNTGVSGLDSVELIIYFYILDINVQLSWSAMRLKFSILLSSI